MSPPIFEWGIWRFETGEYRLTRNGTLVPLPAKTLDLLELLLTRAPNLVTKEDILATVWADAVVEEGNIAFHVAALRKVLDLAQGSCIETVRGRGYRFVAPVISRSPTPAPASAVEPATVAAPPLPVQRRRANYPGIVATAILIGALGVFALSRLRPAEWSVAVMPFEVAEPRRDDGGLATALAGYIGVRLELVGIQVRPLAGAPDGEGPRDARLGADAVLTGTLQHLGQGWRVSVQLTRLSDGVRTWNWTFDASPDENRPVAGPDDERSRLLGLIADRIAQGLNRQLAAAQH